MPVPGHPSLAEAASELQLVERPQVDLRPDTRHDSLLDSLLVSLPPASETTTVTESGSFVRAHCPACGWSAPARRARAMADDDAQGHRAAGHGHRG